MKKIPIYDTNKINAYINSVSIDQFRIGNLMAAVNNGKNHYHVADVFAFLVSSIHKDLSEKKAITNNKFSKIVYAIKVVLNAYNDRNLYIGDDLFEKIESLSSLYIDNRNSTGKEGDSSIIDLLEKVKQELSVNLKFKNKKKEQEILPEEDSKLDVAVEPSSTDSEPEEKTPEELETIIAKLQKRVADLETEVSSYEVVVRSKTAKELKDAKEISKLNKKIDEIKELNAELRKAKRASDKQAETSDKEIVKLNKKIEECATKIDGLNALVDKITAEKEAIFLQSQDDQKTISELTAKLEAQSQELEETRLSLDSATTKQDILDNFIMEQLFLKKMSLNQIMDVLSQNGFDVSREEVLASLRRINQFVSVKPTNGFSKEYGITEPAYRTNLKINYPNNGKTLEVVLLADYHYTGTDDDRFYIQSKLDSVYDYCTANKIRTIITLGDLLDNKNISSVVSKQNYEIIKKMLEDFDKILPFDVKIKHLILGGNHDKGFLQYGIDPIEELSFERDDAISLGYSNAYIYFGGADVIGLHHQGVPRENLVPNFIQSGEETMKNLERDYNCARVNIAERYFDLFGHFHKSRIDIPNAYGVVPSLNADRNADGAWHLTFELDSSGRINDIIIRNLVFGKGKELKTTNEIVYQRTRK